MTFVASTIPNLVSGVSQQPAPSRLRTSGEKMVNAFPSVVSGLIKRPPSEFIKELSPSMTVSDTAAVHVINRDATEKYILVCGDGDLELYDETGAQQTVLFPDGKAYLPTSDIWRKSRFVTVADTTFILNTDKIVTASNLTDTRDDPTATASVFIKRAVASTTYAIYVSGVLAGSTGTKSNVDAASALEGTADIAVELRDNLIANGYTDARTIGTVVTFGVNSGDTVTVDDQFGGGAMQPYTSELQEFTDLPPTEEEGRLINIKGDLDQLGESYWVEFSGGVWTETYGYNAGRKLDATSMPHVLVKIAPNTFEFRENVWKERIAGDTESNPDPSFVGNTINNLFLFKGRLGLLSEENVIMSEVALLESFYRSTVIQLLSSDLIDIASTTGRVSTLYHAASFSDELILFSDKQQFRLSSGNVLSPETVGITSSTGYPCSTLVAPVAVGSSAYFVAPGATHSIAREIFIDADRQTVNGEDIAVQVPSYIPLNIRGMSASASADVFLTLSEDNPNELYVYKWYITERQKIQSAWCKWVFDENTSIVGMGFLEDYLYMVYKVGSDIRIDRILIGPIIDKDLLLDHQFKAADFVSRVYDAVNDETTIVTPYGTPSVIEFYKTDADAFAPYEGVTKSAEDTYVIPGDVTGDSITAGINFEWLYKFSKQYLREKNSDGESAIQDGRLQLRYFSVIYTDTSYFEAHVTPKGGNTSVTVFNGRIFADPDNVVDLIPKDTGEFKFPVFGLNEDVDIELRSNQPYQVAIGSVEWTAVYKQKARRV
jgi:hypothetical protein